jgi:hypothetical protein
MIHRSIAYVLFVALLTAGSPPSRAPQAPLTGSFELDELTVTQLQDAMATGRYTSRRLVELYAADQRHRSGGPAPAQ